MVKVLSASGGPCAGESDVEIVADASDFERINRRYARHLKVLAERPGGRRGGEGVAALGGPPKVARKPQALPADFAARPY